MTGTGHPDETTTALDGLLTVLVYMRRSWAEQRTPDWLADSSSLAVFSNSALHAVAAELRERWSRLDIRARPSQQQVLKMLRAADQMVMDIAALARRSYA